ncbi:TIM barrel protein [Nocardia takedensis]|uniref:TIM barrel protein n=1 Tax=Nocardia takedensis TaxID=259390 RepID=UPI00030588A0|nr:TIM barrel protein [Nocardia takedensis]
MSEPLAPPRVALAPISWGVCEVPGWGTVPAAPVVLSAMASLGVTATEFGPPGYLPTDPAAARALLDSYGLRGIGGFLALPLHRDPAAAIRAARATVTGFAAAGAEILILAAATGLSGYDTRPELTEGQWRTLIATAGAVAELAAAHGLRTVVHPHVGTHVETEYDIERFLADSPLSLCLDTGHLLVGGTDPLLLARRHRDRVGHVHLKDVRLGLLDDIASGALGYTEAVRAGLYPPLGDGDLDVAGLLDLLAEGDYAGWYVLEQDTALGPRDTVDAPTRDAARSLDHLGRILRGRRGADGRELVR